MGLILVHGVQACHLSVCALTVVEACCASSTARAERMQPCSSLAPSSLSPLLL